MAAARKKPTSLTLDPDLLAEAKALKVNLSRAAEAGVREEVARAKAEKWKVENAAALDGANLWVEENGLPLQRHRQF